MAESLRDSRRLAIFVNLAKIALLAALAPPAVAGIAQRATSLGSGLDTAAIVAGTVSTGSVCAVVGALGLGFLADIGRPSLRSRWVWVLLGTCVGTAGLLLMALSASLSALVVGWAAAQLGYSGAMAVLRAILAAALPTHRRRGAVVLVLGAYGGLLIPLAILIAIPNSVWETTFGLAALSLVVPLVFLAVTGRPAGSPEGERDTTGERAAARAEVGTRDAGRSGDRVAGGATNVPEPPKPLSGVALLVIQCAANIVLAAFLSYHPLDLAERAADDAHFPVRASGWVLVAAVVGLLGSTSVLLWRPRLLADGRRMIAGAGALLALSLVLRSICEPMPVIAFAAMLSGAAVGLNNSALLAAALETAPIGRQGRYMGAFSAAGALGQFVGPLAALGLLGATVRLDILPFADPGGYRAMFLILALVPAVWAISIGMHVRRRSESLNAGAAPSTRR